MGQPGTAPRQKLCLRQIGERARTSGGKRQSRAGVRGLLWFGKRVFSWCRRSQLQGSLVSMEEAYQGWRSNYFASIAEQESSGGNGLRSRLYRMREPTLRTGLPRLPLVLMVNSFMLISGPGGCSVFEWMGLRFGNGVILER